MSLLQPLTFDEPLFACVVDWFSVVPAEERDFRAAEDRVIDMMGKSKVIV